MGLFSRKKKETAPSAVATAPPSELVVPLIAGRAWMEANEETFSRIPGFPDEARPFATPISEELWVTYAVDPEGTWEMIQGGQVGDFGGADALHAAALRNLVGRVGSDVAIEGGNGRFRLHTPTEPDLACSLLLAPDLWLSELALTGSAIVCAPTRVELLVCGSDDEDSLQELRTFATELFEEARGKPVTSVLHRAGPSGLAVFA